MSAPFSAEQKIIHFLNRTSFGPSRTEVERVKRIGIPAYLDEQLNPERIQDDLAEEKIAGLKTMRLNNRELFDLYPPPKVAKERAATMMGGEMNAPRLIILELQLARLLRAVYSQRQLYELMVDFWNNHFNIFAAKGADRWLTTSYDRDTIRPNALGKFHDLLLETAKSPAMLFYLDNWLSVSPSGALGRLPAAAQRRGLNENYAREVMELHTLGVDGGYTQNDVREVARCFTGWTLVRPRGEASFRFEPRFHDNGAKTVLGNHFSAGGMEDGLKVIDILARHPATAKFIATKLARRFVSDEPSVALVNRAADAFRRNDGDIPTVVRSILESPEFYAPENYQAKVKKPLEFVASALRLTHADAKVTHQLLRYIGRMGEPLFLAQPPTGYPDLGSSWVSPDMLLTRMNFASDLVNNRLDGARVETPVGRDGESLARLIAPDSLSSTTRAALAEVEEKDRLALFLAAPEFQRR